MIEVKEVSEGVYVAMPLQRSAKLSYVPDTVIIALSAIPSKSRSGEFCPTEAHKSRQESTPQNMTKPTPTCLECKNNDNGKCRLSDLDMYQFRMTLPKYGGCGENAVLYQPKHDLAPEPDVRPVTMELWK